MAKMPNINQLMKMAQDVSKRLEDQLDSIQVEGNAGGGMVKIMMNGHKYVLSTEIAEEVVNPQDIEMLQDLITAAMNDAVGKVDEKTKESVGSMTGMPGGFPFPGM